MLRQSEDLNGCYQLSCVERPVGHPLGRNQDSSATVRSHLCPTLCQIGRPDFAPSCILHLFRSVAPKTGTVGHYLICGIIALFITVEWFKPVRSIQKERLAWKNVDARAYSPRQF